ncbi:hypothetical protein [Sphingomonas sp. Mn802worker]|uniref:hypothetical protein n=1 Tax=Sphingomonas sp. Mn802worker TaxID=629773 RepID=UPI0003A01E3E|nr:hypothetical protein [Sphingomonas sp. Mn802worker]
MSGGGAMMEERWGEARVRMRGRRRVRRAAIVAVLAAAVMVLPPFVSGFIDGFMRNPSRDGAPAGEVIGIAIALLAVIVGAAIWGWRESDEVQRRQAVNAWAAVGVVGFVGHTILQMIERALHLAPMTEQLWWGSLAAGAAVLIWQRVTG